MANPADQHPAVRARQASRAAVRAERPQGMPSPLLDPSLLAAWDGLAHSAAEPNPFFERWYLEPSLQTLDAAGQVSLFRAEVRDRLTGILPLRRSISYYGRPLPHLSSWTHENCFLGAPLVAAGTEREFWRQLFAWADANAGLSLFLHLRSMPLEGPLHEALGDVLAEQQRPSAVVYRELRPVLLRGQSSAEYLAASLSSKERSELRRKQARLGEQGTLAFERTRGSENLSAWIADFLRLEAAGWKGKAGSAMANAPETGQLFRAVIEGAARHGRLERRSLTLEGRPIAMLTTFVTPPGAFGFKTTFDEAYGRYSPGMLLQCANLDALDEGELTWFDSCAREGQGTIDRLWRDRRALGHISVAIGGALRRSLFAGLRRFERQASGQETG